MKTRVFKAFLPLFAMLLGVGLAFSTPQAPLNTGYIEGPTGPIKVQVDCKSETSEACLFLKQQVYEDENYHNPMTKSLP